MARSNFGEDLSVRYLSLTHATDKFLVQFVLPPQKMVLTIDTCGAAVTVYIFLFFLLFLVIYPYTL